MLVFLLIVIQQKDRIPYRRRKVCKIVVDTTDNDKRPHAVIQGKNKSYSALCDTGSEISLVNAAIFEKEKMHWKGKLGETDGVNVITATGGAINIIGKSILRFKIGKRFTIHEFFIAEGLEADILLGADFALEQNIAIVNNGERFEMLWGSEWEHRRVEMICRVERLD